MTYGVIPLDDNDKPVLALWDDATETAIPVHIKSKVQGADGKWYAILDTGSSGGGTQYVDGQSPPTNPTGTSQVFDNSGTWVDVGTDHPLPITGQVTALHGSSVDAQNSSTTLLGASASFTGVWVNGLNYSALSVNIFTDKAGTVLVEQSQDATNADLVDTFSVTASADFQQTINLAAKFYRVVYTNGVSAQTVFRLQTVAQTQDVTLPRTLDASGNLKVAVQNATPLGQATMTNSSPVVIASNQSAVPTSQSDTFGTSTNITAATTFSGVPTISQLAANSYVSFTNPGGQASFLAELNVPSAFVGTLSFYGLEPDGTTLQLINAHMRNSTTIANNSVINTGVALNQVWQGNSSTIKAVYVVCTAFTSGSIAVQLGLSPSPYGVAVLNTAQVDGAAQQGPINITVAGGTSGGSSPTTSGTCTASADNLVTFASRVRTVQMHNQSSVNVPYEHDIAAAATSPYLAPGQLVYVDVHTTSLHVFPPNALPINAASGLMVRGWA